MGQYIHEVVLQDYVIENIADMGISVPGGTAHHQLLQARRNTRGTFWDLEAQRADGRWIPLEIEWISDNFEAHRHRLSEDFPQFVAEQGVVLVLRKNRELADVMQVSILETISETDFKRQFATWFKRKAEDYSQKTLEEFLTGNFRRTVPRVLVYPIAASGRMNYFSQEPLYRKRSSDPLLLGFKEQGYANNVFVRDIQSGDICLFIDANGTRTKRSVFIERVKNGELHATRIAAFRITSALVKVPSPKIKVDDLYWPDEVRSRTVIYPWRCKLSSRPFIDVRDTRLPFVAQFDERRWEKMRSCIQYGTYYEMNASDFALFSSFLIA